MFKNIVFTVFTRFFIAASNLVIAVLLSNQLGAAGRGEQSLIITSVSFIIVITSIIGTSSLSYLLPRHPFAVLILPSFLWIVIVTLLCLAVLPFLSMVPREYAVDICILSFLLSIVNINLSVLISHQKITAVNWLNFIQAFVIILILVLSSAWFDNLSLGVYLWSLYAGYGAALLFSLYFVRKDYAGIRRKDLRTWKEAFRKLVTLGLSNQIAAFAQIMNLRLSYYLLNSFVGKEEVGIYSNAVSIAESIWLIGRSIATVQHSKIVNSRDAGYSMALTSRLNRLNLAVSAALILLLVCIPESWFVFLFGEEFTAINHIIRTLSPGILFFGVYLILCYYFSSTGRPYINAIANIGGLAVTLVAGFLLIPSLESNGAGITASLSYGVMALIVLVYYIREGKKVKRNRENIGGTGPGSPEFSGNDPAVIS